VRACDAAPRACAPSAAPQRAPARWPRRARRTHIWQKRYCRSPSVSCGARMHRLHRLRCGEVGRGTRLQYAMSTRACVRTAAPRRAARRAPRRPRRTHEHRMLYAEKAAGSELQRGTRQRGAVAGGRGAGGSGARGDAATRAPLPLGPPPAPPDGAAAAAAGGAPGAPAAPPLSARSTWREAAAAARQATRRPLKSTNEREARARSCVCVARARTHHLGGIPSQRARLPRRGAAGRLHAGAPPRRLTRRARTGRTRGRTS
jgi:hypothetical protein